jgi:GTP1/Obg family GTP-binding protein
VGVFSILSIIAILVFKKILARIMGGNKTISDSSKYRFNMPDLSEIGVIANKIKTISEDIKELKNIKQPSQAQGEQKHDNDNRFKSIQSQLDQILTLLSQNNQVLPRLASIEKSLASLMNAQADLPR